MSVSGSIPVSSSGSSGPTAPARPPSCRCCRGSAARPPGGSPSSAATRPIAQARRLLGSTPQETALPDTLRVGEVIDYVGGHFADRAPTSELAAEFGLDDLLRRQCGSLSGGQKRRVAVALAFVGRPRLVLLDEPTTGLDVDARRTLWAAIRRQHEAGATVVVTSHYLEEIEALAQRVVVIGDGRVLADDTVARVPRPRRASAASNCRRPTASTIAALPSVVQHESADGREMLHRDRRRRVRAGARGVGCRLPRPRRARSDARGSLPRAHRGTRTGVVPAASLRKDVA